jgi:hypothetical protein
MLNVASDIAGTLLCAGLLDSCEVDSAKSIGLHVGRSLPYVSSVRLSIPSLKNRQDEFPFLQFFAEFFKSSGCMTSHREP